MDNEAAEDLLALTEQALNLKEQKFQIVLQMMKNFMMIISQFTESVDLDEYEDEWVAYVAESMSSGMKILVVEEGKGTIQ